MDWIDNMKLWTDGGLDVARENARRCQWPNMGLIAPWDTQQLIKFGGKNEDL